MKFFSIAGWSDSGKTSLITGLIRRFKEKGKRVAAVKYTPHGYQLQPEGKDSRRFLEAGAEDVLVIARGELLHMQPLRDTLPSREQLEKKMPEADIVFLEGIYPEGVPVLELVQTGTRKKMKFSADRLAAVISSGPLNLPIPCLDAGDVEKIACFMEEYHGSEN